MPLWVTKKDMENVIFCVRNNNISPDAFQVISLTSEVLSGIKVSPLVVLMLMAQRCVSLQHTRTV